MNFRWLRPFGVYYLTVFAVGIVGYVMVLLLSGDAHWSSPSYRFLFEWIPRQWWALPWGITAAACALGVIINTPAFRRHAMFMLISMTACWMFGLLTAFVVAPRNGSPGGPVVYCILLAIHLRIARVPSESRTFWEIHGPSD